MLEFGVPFLSAEQVVTILPQGKEAGVRYFLGEEVNSVAAETQKLVEK